MFDSTVLPLGIFTNGDQINIVIESLIAFNRAAGPDIGKQIKHSGKTRIWKDSRIIGVKKINKTSTIPRRKWIITFSVLGSVRQLLSRSESSVVLQHRGQTTQ